VRAGRSPGYRSSVCSTPEPSLDDLTRAIDELAAASRAGTAPGDLNERIARLWGMVADLDPELARRLSRYQRASGGQADPGGGAGGGADPDSTVGPGR
jgi:hypothetical protein